MACCSPAKRCERSMQLSCALLLCKTADKKVTSQLVDVAAVRCGETVTVVADLLQTYAAQIPWSLLAQLFPSEPLALLTANHDSISTALHKSIQVGQFDSHTTNRGIKDRLHKLSEAFTLIGRNCITMCCSEPQHLKDNGIATVVSVLHPLPSDIIKAIAASCDTAQKNRKLQLEAQRFQAPGSTDSPSPPPKKQRTDNSVRKYCPPVSLGFAAAMLVSLGNQVLTDLTIPEKMSAKDAKSRIIRSILLRDLQINLTFGKRPCELRGVTRYDNIYCMFGADRVPLRVLQLSGHVSSYLQAGFPVVFELFQGKALKKDKPLRVVRTALPDELSLFDPIIGTLLHYQVWDLCSTAAMNLPDDSPSKMNFKPQWEFPIDTQQQKEGKKHSSNIQKWKDTWIFKHGMALEPVCSQLYGMDRIKENLHHTSYAMRYSLMGTLAMLHCNLKAVANAMGHQDPESQNGYSENNLLAHYEDVGMMDPKLEAKNWYYTENDMPNITASPLYTNHLCLATEVLVDSALLHQVLGDKVVPVILAAHEKFYDKGELTKGEYAPETPCMPLRIDGFKNIGKLIVNAEGQDCTPKDTALYLQQRADVLHARQGITCIESAWDLRFTGQLLGAVLRPFRATELTVQRLSHDVGYPISKLHAVIAADENVSVVVDGNVRSKLQQRSRLLDQYAHSATTHMLHTQQLFQTGSAPAPAPPAPAPAPTPPTPAPPTPAPSAITRIQFASPAPPTTPVTTAVKFNLNYSHKYCQPVTYTGKAQFNTAGQIVQLQDITVLTAGSLDKNTLLQHAHNRLAANVDLSSWVKVDKLGKRTREYQVL